MPPQPPPPPSSFSALAAKFITQQQSQHSQQSHRSTSSGTSGETPLFYSTYSHKPRRRSGSASSGSSDEGSERSTVDGDEREELPSHPPAPDPITSGAKGYALDLSETTGQGLEEHVPSTGLSQLGMGMGMGATMGMLRGSVDPFRRDRDEAGSSSSRASAEEGVIEEEYEAEHDLGPGGESISLLPTSTGAATMAKQQQHQQGRSVAGASKPRTDSQGWRAHPPSRAESDSGSASSRSSGEETQSDGVPPSYLLTPRKMDEVDSAHSDSEEEEQGARNGRSRRHKRQQGVGDSMLESLLPQDQLRIRPSLGHVLRLPHAGYTVLFGLLLIVSTVLSLYALIFTPKSSPLPHLTHTLPLLTLLTGLSLLLPPIHIALLRIAVKPALYGTYFLLPVLVLIASLYSFAGSFWSQSLALRIISPLPLLPLILTLPTLPRRLPSLTRSSHLLQLSATLLLRHPSALAAIMVAALGGAILGGIIGGGGVRLVFGGSLPTWVAGLPILMTLVGYATLLSLRRIVLGNIVGRWYLAAPPRQPPDQHESTREAIILATGPQFGTAVLGALILSLSRTLVWVVWGVQRLITVPWLPIPPQLSPMAFLLYLLNSLEGYNGKTMLLTGINPSGLGTGAPGGGNFWSTVKTVQSLERGPGRLYRNYDLTRTLLHLLVLLSSLLAALSAYFYSSSNTSDSGTLGSAKWRERKAEDVWAAVLAGALCWGLGEFGLGSLGDVADALWCCFAMDLEAGRTPRADVGGAFEGRGERVVRERDVEAASAPGRAAPAYLPGSGAGPVPGYQYPQERYQEPRQGVQVVQEFQGGESVMSGMGGMGMSSGLFD